MQPTIDAVDHEVVAIGELVRQAAFNHTADQSRTRPMDRIDRQVALQIPLAHCPLQGPDDVAALAHPAQGGLEIVDRPEHTGRGLADEPQTLELA